MMGIYFWMILAFAVTVFYGVELLYQLYNEHKQNCITSIKVFVELEKTKKELRELKNEIKNNANNEK